MTSWCESGLKVLTGQNTAFTPGYLLTTNVTPPPSFMTTFHAQLSAYCTRVSSH